MSPHPQTSADDGLTATGGALLATLLTCAGALVDVVVSRTLSWGFTVGFLLACLWVGSRIERRHLLAGAIVPPWAFVVGLLLAQQVLGLGGSGSWLLREVTDISTLLALRAPLLLGGEALAVVIVLSRWLRHRHDDRALPAPRLAAQPPASEAPTPEREGPWPF